MHKINIYFKPNAKEKDKDEVLKKIKANTSTLKKDGNKYVAESEYPYHVAQGLNDEAFKNTIMYMDVVSHDPLPKDKVNSIEEMQEIVDSIPPASEDELNGKIQWSDETLECD